MSRHRERPVAHACEAIALRALLAAFRALPFAAALAAGRLVGRLLALLDRRHLRVARDQLSDAFGRGSPEAESARSVYEHLGMCVAELAWVKRRVALGEVGSWVAIEGLEHVRAALAKGKGLAIVSGHLGNWELGAVAMASAGIPISIVARPMDNPRLERVLLGIRQAGGSEVIAKRNALRAVREVLSRGRALAVLIDQDAREHGTFVEFFGRPASTIPSIAAIALRTGAPLVVCAMRREPGCLRHTLAFEPVEPPAASGDSNEDARRLTALLTARLEARIRLAPAQWLWMHRRWKTRPA